MLNIKSFFITVVVILFFAITGLAQQSISPEKKALIQELRELTESATLDFSATFGNIKEPFTAQIEKDTELTDSQKQELKKLIVETRERLDKQAQDFLADKSIKKQITDEIVIPMYDKQFIETELRELITFYRTPTGQKAAKFMLTVNTKLANAIGEAYKKKLQDFMTPKLQMEFEQIPKKIREAKQQAAKPVGEGGLNN